jgi:photosystem II stability/assembly factor-like uncharacterized protein
MQLFVILMLAGLLEMFSVASFFVAASRNISLTPVQAVYGDWEALASDPTGQRVYAIVSLPISLDGYMCYLYMSTDYGSTWAEMPAKFYCLAGSYQMRFRFHLSVDNSGCNVFAGQFTMSPSYVTTDCGKTWSGVNSVGASAIAADSSGRHLIGIESGTLIISDTYGYTWSMEVVRNFSVSYMAAMVSDNVTENVIIASCQDNVGHKLSIYHTANISAASWSINSMKTKDPCFDVVLAGSDSATFLIMANGYQVFQSTDYGANWTILDRAPAGHWWTSVACDATCGHVVLGSNATNTANYPVLYSSKDFAQSWEIVAADFPAAGSQYSTVTISKDGNFIAAGTSASTYPPAGYIGVNTNPYLNIAVVVQASTASVDYTFSDMGFVGDQIYLSVTMLSSCMDRSVDNLQLTIYISNDGNEIEIYTGVCAPSARCEALNISCAVNLPIHPSFINTNNIYGDGTLTVTAVINTGSVQYRPCPTVSAGSEYMYRLQFQLSAQPETISATSYHTITFHPLVLTVIIVVMCSWGLVGHWLGSKFNKYPYARKISRSEVTLHLALLGYLVTTEIWFLIIFQLHDTVGYFRWLSYALIGGRATSLLPGLFLLMKMYGPSAVKSSFYLDNMDLSFVRDNTCTLKILSALLLLDPGIVIYFPWKTTLPVDKHFGYPDTVTLDLCSIFKAVGSMACIVAQCICYRYALQRDHGLYWNSYELGIRLILIFYLLVFLLSCLPTIRVLYSYILEVVDSPIARRPVKQAIQLWMDAVRSYQFSPRWHRLKQRQRIPFRVLLCFVKWAIVIAVYISVLTWKCEPGNADQYAPVSSDKSVMWLRFFFAVAVAVTVALSLHVFSVVEYDDYDPHIDMLEIAKTYRLDAEKLAVLLSPLSASFSLVEMIYLVFLFVIHNSIVLMTRDFVSPASFYAPNRYNTCRKPADVEILHASLLEFVFVLECLSPLLIWTEYSWRKSGSWLQTVKAMVRFDIFCVFLFLKAMVAWVSPLCVLTNMSIWKAKYLNEQGSDPAGTEGDSMRRTGELLSCQLRDNWLGVDNEDHDNTILAYFFVICDRLRKRFTVVYSLCKLCGTIAFTLFVNTDYLACGDMGAYRTAATCPVAYTWQPYPVWGPMENSQPCASLCIGHVYPSKIVYPEITVPRTPPLPPTPWECSVQISNECICNNWFIFQFIVIALHVVHYLIQCYFYVRYDYFDPQQHQINCVETYSFAGENLTLFLTQPSICLLSTIEAICIVLVWIEVIFPFGGYCVGTVTYDTFDMQFAVFITFVEVYKANLSTFGKLCMQREYWWALWSLIRIDLFVFYGLTLFLQSFFFPFSLLGYNVSKYMRLNGEEEALDEGLLKKSVVVVGKNDVLFSLKMVSVGEDEDIKSWE